MKEFLLIFYSLVFGIYLNGILFYHLVMKIIGLNDDNDAKINAMIELVFEFLFVCY